MVFGGGSGMSAGGATGSFGQGDPGLADSTTGQMNFLSW